MANKRFVTVHGYRSRWKTCHLCQLRQHRKLRIPPTVAKPGGLCVCWHIDSMKMPKSSGFSIIVVARCSVSAWPEWRMLRAENDKTLGDFIFQDLLCRWGAATKLVTDNGSAFISAVRSLEKRYHIHHIKVSPYNSQANGIAERSHFDMRQILFKAAGGDQRKWSQVAHHAFWAERVTVRKRMGCSPYFAVTGCHPVLPLDIAEATYLVPPPTGLLSTVDLIARRAMELQKRSAEVRARARSYYFATTTSHLARYVLMRHTQIEKSLNRKTAPALHWPTGSNLGATAEVHVSNKRLSELIASDDNGEDDPEPELIGGPIADPESDEDSSSESSLDD
ncbi:hypothetical protein NUW54_g13043 [Trametes sanguinea]|uniref:Uncharacterized protein n=1 Tax=Trametes sanguinea TaxID=158606 RepID=A0ACC1MQ02_9APHY|nr:hypothetical protein NUW54_g13043 [Trametes sanguinea]